MGHELWTSPITGYRRRGTRLAELRALLASGITARAILEPLRSCPAIAPSAEMRRTLHARSFDIAGVRQESDGPVIGYVMTESLKDGVVKDHMIAIALEQLISEATPLVRLLSILKDRSYVFVLSEREVVGIVTRADLNKPPVRVYLFGLISLLEMHLGYWVKVSYREDSWKKFLKPNRLVAAQKVQTDGKARKQDMVLVECLQFCDRRDLVVANTGLRESLGLATKGQARDVLKSAERLRDLLAHSQQDLANGSSWEHLIDLVEVVEKLVQKSDESVEDRARRSAQQGQDGLWPSA